MAPNLHVETPISRMKPCQFACLPGGACPCPAALLDPLAPLPAALPNTSAPPPPPRLGRQLQIKGWCGGAAVARWRGGGARRATAAPSRSAALSSCRQLLPPRRRERASAREQPITDPPSPTPNRFSIYDPSVNSHPRAVEHRAAIRNARLNVRVRVVGQVALGRRAAGRGPRPPAALVKLRRNLSAFPEAWGFTPVLEACAGAAKRPRPVLSKRVAKFPAS